MSVQKIIQTINSEFAPAIQTLKKGVENYLPESHDQTWMFLESSALVHLASVTIRNIPYALLANGFGVNNVFHFISSRTNYLEAACNSTASAVYNFFLAIFYTGMMAITLGLSGHFNYCCKKHWMHIVYSISALGISILGMISPFVGSVLTMHLFAHYFQVLKSNYEGDVANFEEPLLRTMKNVFFQNRKRIENFIRDRVSQDRYDPEFAPSLREIGNHLANASKMDDLVKLIINCWYKFPLMQNKEIMKAELPKEGQIRPAAKDHFPAKYAI